MLGFACLIHTVMDSSDSNFLFLYTPAIPTRLFLVNDLVAEVHHLAFISGNIQDQRLRLQPYSHIDPQRPKNP